MATYEPFSCYVHVDDDTGGIIWPDSEEGPNWGIGKVMTRTRPQGGRLREGGHWIGESVRR